MRPETRVEAAAVAALALSLWVVAYSVLRVIQARLFPEADPALVVWSTRIGMFWRMGQAAYLALLASPLLLRWARLDRDGICRAAAWVVPASVSALLAQAALVP